MAQIRRTHEVYVDERALLHYYCPDAIKGTGLQVHPHTSRVLHTGELYIGSESYHKDAFTLAVSLSFALQNKETRKSTNAIDLITKCITC